MGSFIPVAITVNADDSSTTAIIIVIIYPEHQLIRSLAELLPLLLKDEFTYFLKIRVIIGI